MQTSGTWIDLVQERAPLDKAILAPDNSGSQTYDEQQRSDNGHFELTGFDKVLMPIRIRRR